MVDWFKNITDKELLDYFCERYSRVEEDITISRRNAYSEIIIDVQVETLDPRDSGNDRTDFYHYNAFGEVEARKECGYCLKPFNNSIMDRKWVELIAKYNKSSNYFEILKTEQEEAIIYECSSKIRAVDREIEKLQRSKDAVIKKADIKNKEFMAYLEEVKQKNESDNLLVKAFFENMSSEERKNWLLQNGIIEQTIFTTDTDRKHSPSTKSAGVEENTLLQ